MFGLANGMRKDMQRSDKKIMSEFPYFFKAGGMWLTIELWACILDGMKMETQSAL